MKNGLDFERFGVSSDLELLNSFCGVYDGCSTVTKNRISNLFEVENSGTNWDVANYFLKFGLSDSRNFMKEFQQGLAFKTLCEYSLDNKILLRNPVLVGFDDRKINPELLYNFVGQKMFKRMFEYVSRLKFSSLDISSLNFEGEFDNILNLRCEDIGINVKEMENQIVSEKIIEYGDFKTLYKFRDNCIYLTGQVNEFNGLKSEILEELVFQKQNFSDWHLENLLNSKYDFRNWQKQSERMGYSKIFDCIERYLDKR